MMHRDRRPRLPRHLEQRLAMPPAAPASNAVAGTREQATALGTRSPVPATSGHGTRKVQALLPRRAARRAQSALPAAARSDTPGGAPAEFPGGRLRRIPALLRPVPTTRGSHYDPLFNRPDLIEDDYYRFRRYPGC